MKPTHFKILTYSLLGFLTAALILLGYWSFQSTNVFKLNSPISVKPPVISPGGFATLTFDYCKLQSVVGTTRTSFVSKSTEIFQPTIEDHSKAACNRVELPIIIPKQLPPDTYYIKFRTTYQLNPIRSVIQEIRTESFEIK